VKNLPNTSRVADSNNFCGALLVDKPEGITSAGIIKKIQKHFNIKKIGHTGTLDPMATGLLIVLLGKATRLQDFLMSGEKRYGGEILLGVETDSDDITGKELERKEVNRNEVANLIPDILGKFTGKLQQTPPQYSAIKIAGKRSYKIAREGQIADLQSREIEIYDLELELISDNRLRYQVRCSKGTYVRSLARDIGEYLGCGACLASIRREASSGYDVAQAIDVESLFRLEDLEPKLISQDRLLKDIPELVINEEFHRQLLQGKQEVLKDIPIEPELKEGVQYLRLVNDQGTLLGILQTQSEEIGCIWRIRFMV
jgi:tRNA pseudouridine55 synthase